MNRICVHAANLFLLMMLVAAPASPAFADNTVGETNPQTLLQRQHAPKSAIDEKKLEIAKQLTDWMNQTLQKREVLVAVVARRGGGDVKKHDKTGMAHSGLAVYDPRAQSYIVYNLLNENQQATQWRTAPLDFFYGQTGYDLDALLLIPDKETQSRMYQAILDGRYKQLLWTKQYNLLSSPTSLTSINCNKWLLANVAAARIDDYKPEDVVKAITDGFEPGQLHLSTFEWIAVRRKKNVLQSELPRHNPIPTVTVESLYRSEMFADKLFYSGKTL